MSAVSQAPVPTPVVPLKSDGPTGWGVTTAAHADTAPKRVRATVAPTPTPVASAPAKRAPVVARTEPRTEAQAEKHEDARAEKREEPRTEKRPTAPHDRYTIQLAAYNTRPEAEVFAAGLVKRGLPARVSGEVKPFRVRLGYYPTRSAAAKEVAALKARGIVSFVAEEP